MVTKHLTVSTNVGVEMVNEDNNHVTGFSIVNFDKKKRYEDSLTKAYYIVVVLQGEVKLSCRIYQNKQLVENTMSFVPKDSPLECVAENNAQIMLFSFSTTILQAKQDVLKYFCENARKFNRICNTLSVGPEMRQVVDLIATQLLSRKLKSCQVCDAWNTLFFSTMLSYYPFEDIVPFMRPLINAVVDFHSFIENNYRASGGNVKSLIAMSGIPYVRFHKLFVQSYGMSAKSWLDMKAQNRILEMAATPGMTVKEMAVPFKMSTQHFCSLCRRLFGCTPSQLIHREKERIQEEAEENPQTED